MFIGLFNPVFFTSMLVLIPGIIFGIYAQMKVKKTYEQYSKVPAQSGLSGAQVSRQLLDQAGLQDIGIEQIPGNLSDHYDPRARVLRLSEGVASGRSLAALGVAAHETGHAIQDQAHYVPMRIRTALVPAANLGTNVGWMIFILGFFMAGLRGPFMTAGIALFSAAVVFQLVTLPVELDASSRAMRLLQGGGLVMGQEAEGTGKVLRAAALTYVAAALMSILTLVRMILISRQN